MSQDDMGVGRAFVPEASSPAVSPVPASIPDATWEAAARAIAAAKRGLDSHDPAVDKVWPSYVGQARAAILAHRGPPPPVKMDERTAVAWETVLKAMDACGLPVGLSWVCMSDVNGWALWMHFSPSMTDEMIAQGTSAGTAKTEGLGATPAGPVACDAPSTPQGED